MKGRARVLDSTPIYDAVATEDTVTQLRAAIRKLLGALDQAASPLAAAVRAALFRDDDYATPGKPPCDWDDRTAREALVDALVRDALAALGRPGRPRSSRLGRLQRSSCSPWSPAKTSKTGDDGVFRIVRGVAKDRVISTVDPEARHGHKSRNRHFDGYKAHLSIDPDSELIDEVVATPANTPDRDAAGDLLAPHAEVEDKPEVLGDSAYADGATRDALGAKGFSVTAKCPPVRNATGGFTKDRFEVDLETNTVTCPAGQHVAINPTRDGGGRALVQGPLQGLPAASGLHQVTSRAHASPSAPMKRPCNKPAPFSACPDGPSTTGPTDPSSNARSPTSSAVHGEGGKARTRGKERVATDLDTRAGAINWARLAALGLQRDHTGWLIAGT